MTYNSKIHAKVRHIFSNSYSKTTVYSIILTKVIYDLKKLLFKDLQYKNCTHCVKVQAFIAARQSNLPVWIIERFKLFICIYWAF